GDVIAVAGAALVGVGWAHAVAAMVKQTPAQERGRAPQPAAPLHRLGRELSFYRLEQRGIENGLVLTVVNLAPVDHLADIEAVLEQMGECPHASRWSGRSTAAAACCEFLGDRDPAPARGRSQARDSAQRSCEPPQPRLVPQRSSFPPPHSRVGRAADPNAFALRGSDLVAHPLPDQLAFELSK